MTITWAQAREKVRGDLWRPGANGVPDDVCDRSLHAALLEIESERRWLWLENIRISDALATAANQVQLPPDLSTVTSLVLIGNGGSECPLTLLSIGRIRALQQENRTGAPAAYALSGGRAFIDSLAPAGSVFDLVYTARTPDDVEAAAAAPVNRTLQTHQALVIAGACARVAMTYLKNTEEAARQLAVFDRGVDRLNKIEDEARGDQFGGLIQPDNSYSSMAWGH